MRVRCVPERQAGSFAAAVKEQFTHVEWEGFRFYDFIFPLFQFLIGVAIPLSIANGWQAATRKGRSCARPLSGCSG